MILACRSKCRGKCRGAAGADAGASPGQMPEHRRGRCRSIAGADAGASPGRGLVGPWSGSHARSRSSDQVRAEDPCRDGGGAYVERVRTFDGIETQVLVERIFSSAGGDPIALDADDFEEASPDHPDRYIAHMALNDTEAEVTFVEALNARRKEVACPDDDPAAVASLQRLARTAWTHHYRARNAAANAAWDPVVGPLAARAVARARRAAQAISFAAARGVMRAAIRARRAARARASVPMYGARVRRLAARSPRPRAAHVRRVRLSAVA
jgi:hypothetical protein